MKFADQIRDERKRLGLTPAGADAVLDTCRKKPSTTLPPPTTERTAYNPTAESPAQSPPAPPKPNLVNPPSAAAMDATPPSEAATES